MAQPKSSDANEGSIIQNGCQYVNKHSNLHPAPPMQSMSITKPIKPIHYQSNTSVVNTLPTFNQQLNYNVSAVLQEFMKQFPAPQVFALPYSGPTTPHSQIPQIVSSVAQATSVPSFASAPSQPMPIHPPMPQNNNDVITCTSPGDSKQAQVDYKISCQPKASNKAQSPKQPPKRKGKHKSNDPNVYQYQPPKSIRAHKTIYIHDQITKSKTYSKLGKIKCHLDHKNKSNCTCNPLYLLIDMAISMQFDTYLIHGDVKIFNLGEELSKPFCVVAPIKDCKKIEKYKRSWEMKQLFSKEMILKKFRLNANRLPLPVRKTPTYQVQLLQKDAIIQFFANLEKVEEVINTTKWNKIKVFSTLNNKRRRELKMIQCEFQNDLRKSCMHNGDFDLIPIVLFRNKHYTIHYLIIVKIDESNVGISMIYKNSSKYVEITGIHLDKTMIQIQHQWASLEHLAGCNHECLDNFESHIDHLRIGNIDEDANKIKALRKQLKSNN